MANLDIMKEGNIFASRYELLRLLGRGGFSEVWLARDNKTQRDLALKVYSADKGFDSEGLKMFTQEFSVVTGINHTNLLRPTYFDEWNGIPYLTLPYCRNGSAFKYLNADNKITEKECWNMLCDVSSGLAYLHEKNPVIIHLDIKPDNILINDEGHYMITDFGISKRIRRTLLSVSDKDIENNSGTTAYMGPERFGTNPRTALANDIWSLGATMFEIMTGFAPFGNEGGLLQKKGADIPDIQDDNYSEELKQIVYLCLSKETYERPTARQLSEYTDLRIKKIAVEEIVRRQDNAFTKTLSKTLNISTDVTNSKTPTLPFWRKKKFWLPALGLFCVIALLLASMKCQNTKSEPSDVDSVLADTIDKNETDTLTTPIESNNIDVKENSTPEQENHVKVNPNRRHLTPVNEPEPSPKTDGKISIGGATYSGELSNGKPNGRGELLFTTTQTFQKREVHAGYKAEGRFEKGRLVVGRIYDENGEKKYTINYD